MIKLTRDSYKEPKISRLTIFFDGDIAELFSKIAQIRTWTYISNHQNWLTNAIFWQEKTLQIENNLSDNLHMGLTNKFVDTNSRYFIKSNNEGLKPIVEIDLNRNLTINRKIYGKLDGFTLIIQKNEISDSLFLLSHVKKSIRIRGYKTFATWNRF